MRKRDQVDRRIWQPRKLWRDLARDRSGSALIYTTISLPVLIGFALLAIDASRFVNLHSHLQHAADALAIAGAAELDRRPSAINRAKLAIETLIENEQRFGDDGAVLITCADVDDAANCDVAVRFLSEIPANDSDPIPTGSPPETADPAAARFIEVTVDPQGFSTILPASFVGGSNSAQTNATAVAGFDAAVCNFTPMFICNPYEDSDPSTPTIFQAAEDPGARKRQLRLHSVPGGGSALTPGNFSLLKAPGDPTLSALKKMLAVDQPAACFIQNGVDTKPGISGIGNWINVRFDLYKQGSTGPYKDDAAYRPAHNVRKGYKVPTTGPSPECNKEPDDTGSSKGLPRDACFATDTCSAGAGTYIGDGDFAAAMEEYWLVNYQTALPLELVGKSRYEVYRYEIEKTEAAEFDYLGHQSLIPTQETGELYCSSSATSPDPDRRILYAAVINCLEHNIHGNETDIPVEAFAEFFLTEPVKHEPSNPEAIWIELKGIVEPGNYTSIARDLVQLYR